MISGLIERIAQQACLYRTRIELEGFEEEHAREGKINEALATNARLFYVTLQILGSGKCLPSFEQKYLHDAIERNFRYLSQTHKEEQLKMEDRARQYDDNGMCAKKLFLDFLKRKDLPRAKYYNHIIYQNVFSHYCNEKLPAVKEKLRDELEKIYEIGIQLVDLQLNQPGGTA